MSILWSDSQIQTKHEYEFYESSIFEDNKVICATFTQRITVRIYHSLIQDEMVHSGLACSVTAVSATQLVWRAEYT